MELYANMHTHSTHSDGGFSPRDVVRICKEEGYTEAHRLVCQGGVQQGGGV